MKLQLLPLLVAAPLQAVSLLQLESFDSPTGWASGAQNPNPPGIVADSGPLGPGDNALRIVGNGGGGSGSRLVAYNTTDWAGDYSHLGITTLTMDLRNVDLTHLVIHVAVIGPGGEFVTPGQALNRFLPWSQHTFSLLPGDLLIAGGDDVDATLAGVTELRILHSNSNNSFRGDVVNGQLLVDNIRAVPEPSVLLLGLGSLVLTTRRKR